MRIRSADFESEIARAMDRLPKFLKEAIAESGVAVLTEDVPPPDVDDDPDEPVFAYFIGPTSDEFDSAKSPDPPRIVLYRSTFESACETKSELREELYRTLIHELGHFLGFEEDEIEDV